MRMIFSALMRFSSSWIGTIIIVLLLIFFVAQAFMIPSRSMVGTLYEGDFLFVKKFSYGIPTPRIPWLEVPLLPDFNNNGHLIEGKRPKRGDIVVFIPPHSPKQYYVKRTFAIGGDEVIFTPLGLYLHPKEGNDYALKLAHETTTPYTQNLLEMQGKLFVYDPYLATHFGVNMRGGHVAFFEMLAIYQRALLENRSPFAYTMQTRGIAMEPIIQPGNQVFFYKKIADDEFFMIGDNRNNSEDSRFWGSVPYRNIIGEPWFIYFSMNLADSVESGAKSDPKQRYSIRWERMFQGISGIEELAKQRAQEESSTQNIAEQQQHNLKEKT